MEINHKSRIVKDHEVGEIYEVIRFRRAKVMNFSTQTSINDEAKVGDAPPTIVNEKNAKYYSFQTGVTTAEKYVQAAAEAYANTGTQMECTQKSVETETENSSAVAKTQTDYADKVASTQTDIEVVDVHVQTNTDCYFKPLREHGLSENNDITPPYEIHKNPSPIRSVSQSRTSTMLSSSTANNMENSSLQNTMSLPQLLRSENIAENNEPDTLIHRRGRSREITPIILTASPECHNGIRTLNSSALESLSATTSAQELHNSANNRVDLQTSQSGHGSRRQLNSHSSAASPSVQGFTGKHGTAFVSFQRHGPKSHNVWNNNLTPSSSENSSSQQLKISHSFPGNRHVPSEISGEFIVEGGYTATSDHRHLLQKREGTVI